MIELDERAKKHIEYIAENGTTECIDNRKDCRKCMLSCFNNENMSCQEIAKELLKLIKIQKYLKPIPFNKVYSESTLMKCTKEELIDQIQALQYNYVETANAFDNQANIFIKFFTEHKGEIEVNLKYKEGK